MTLQVALSHQMGDFELKVDFTVPNGVTVLFGPSGAGKSSIIRAVAGLLRPDLGRISLNDQVFVDSDKGIFVPAHRRKMGYVFQEARLFPHLTVGQNLRYARLFHRAARQMDAAPLIEMLGIAHLLKRRPAALSGGEAARVGIARALLSAPQMLLLDEPLAALDRARKDEILPYLERVRDQAGVPILYVTHAEAEVARLATTVVRIEQGRVIEAR